MKRRRKKVTRVKKNDKKKQETETRSGLCGVVPLGTFSVLVLDFRNERLEVTRVL